MADKKIAKVVQDVIDKYNTSYNYRQEIKFETNLDTWKDMYEGTSADMEEREKKGRAHLYPHWPATLVDQNLARYSLVILGKKPYFIIQPLNEKSIAAAKVAHKLVAYQIQRPTAVYQLIRFIHQGLSYGFSTLKTSWDFATNDVRLLAVKPKNFFWAPYTDDLNKLPWAIHQVYVLKSVLEAQNKAFKDKYGEDLYQNLDKANPVSPDDEDTNKYTENEEGIWLYEYWDEAKKTVVANKEILLLETDNPTMHRNKKGVVDKPGIIPFINISGIPKLDSILGKGEPESIYQETEHLSTIWNQRIDNVNMALRPPWLENKAYQIFNPEDLSNLRTGLRIICNVPYGVDPRYALQQLEIRDVTAGSYQEAAVIEKGIEERGMPSPLRGMVPSKRMTATEHMGLQSEGSNIIKFKIMFVIKTAFSLLPMHIVAWDKKYLSDKKIVDVMGRQDGVRDFKTGIITANKTEIEGDFEFLEKVSAFDIDATSDVKRAQLLEAFMYAVQAKDKGIELPGVDMGRIMLIILETFDISELNAMINKVQEGQEENQMLEQAIRKVLEKMGPAPGLQGGGGAPTLPGGNGGGRGGSQMPGQQAIPTMPGGAKGDILAAVMGKTRGGM